MIIIFIRIINHIKGILARLLQFCFRIALPDKSVRKHDLPQRQAGGNFQFLRHFARRNCLANRKTEISRNRIVLCGIFRRINRLKGMRARSYTGILFYPFPSVRQRNVCQTQSLPISTGGQCGCRHIGVSLYHCYRTYRRPRSASGTAYDCASRRYCRNLSHTVHGRYRRVIAAESHIADVINLRTVYTGYQLNGFIDLQAAYRCLIQRNGICHVWFGAGRCRHITVYRNFKYEAVLQRTRTVVSIPDLGSLRIGRLNILHVLMGKIRVVSACNIKLL